MGRPCVARPPGYHDLLLEVAMRSAGIVLASVLVLGALAPNSRAAPEGWHTSIQEGLDAAARSGKPVLVVTGWKSGV